MPVKILPIMSIKATCDNCGALEDRIVIEDNFPTAYSKMPTVREILRDKGWQLSESNSAWFPNSSRCPACSKIQSKTDEPV